MIKEQNALVLLVPEWISSSREVWFYGYSVENLLKQLHEWAFFGQDFNEIDGCTFQISGDHRLYEFNGSYFHYCFDHGRINVEKLLDIVCYEE